MIKEVKKVFNDTLKSPQGKYSRKSLTMLSSYIIVIVMSLSSFFLGYEINNLVIGFFMGLAGGNNYLVFKDKKKALENKEA